MSSRTQRGIALPRTEYASRNRLPMPRPTPMPSCDPWLALRASTRRTISTALGDRVFGLRPPGRVPARFNRLQPWGLHRREGATAHTAQRDYPGSIRAARPAGPFRRLRWRFCPGGPGNGAAGPGPTEAGTAGAHRTPSRVAPRCRRRAWPSAAWRDPPPARSASARAADVGWAGDVLLVSEPALELRPRGAARHRAVEEVPQAVRADGDRGGGTPQGHPRGFPPDGVTQQWDRERGNVAAAGAHTSCALCAVLRNLHGDTLAEVGKPRKRAGGRRQPGPFPPCSIISTSARMVPGALPSSRLFTRISASIWRRITSAMRRSRSTRTSGCGSRMWS